MKSQGKLLDMLGNLAYNLKTALAKRMTMDQICPESTMVRELSPQQSMQTAYTQAVQTTPLTSSASSAPNPAVML